MATVFGISGLKSKLGDWRASLRSTDAAEQQSVHNLKSENPVVEFRLVDSVADDRDLSLVLENLVIPRLIADSGQRDSNVTAEDVPSTLPIARSPLFDAEDVVEFSRLSLSADTHQLLDFVDRCLQTGSSVETIYVELLAPAARQLGTYWEEDSRDFVDVTMGLWRIQEVLRELTMRMPPAAQPGHGQRAALFCPMPGEQHSLGTLMITECFQRAGWDADALIEPTPSDISTKVSGQHYDLIGLTVSCDCSSAAIHGTVNMIKTVSVNPHIRILLGGRVINDRPTLVTECGADATTSDARDAVVLADRLVPLKANFFAQLS
jgi:MerR family transcriptional regulator, light-induced transcriptional regulator